jgi:hypothetical protein
MEPNGMVGQYIQDVPTAVTDISDLIVLESLTVLADEAVRRIAEEATPRAISRQLTMWLL